MIATPTSPLDATVNNLYNAPGADLSQAPVASATYAPRFFSWRGRVGRARYFAYLMGAWLLAVGVMIPIGIGIAITRFTMNSFSTFLPLLMLACCVGASVFSVVRRLNDLNQSGWLAPLMLNIGKSAAELAKTNGGVKGQLQPAAVQ